jgi:polysaccharide export outer membrane protein
MMAKFELKAFSLFILLCATSIGAQTVATPKTSGQPEAKTQPVSFPGTQVRDERYRIGFQDTLDVQIFRHPELAQKVSVNSNGTINLFRIPTPLVAVCKTERELATDVAAAYEKDYLKNPEVNVVAVEQRSQAFAVIGAVEKPGSYFINRKVRLLELLAQAGGPSKEAGTRVLVARTGSTSNCKVPDANATALEDVALFDFKISDILEAKQNLVMQPGDIVSVLDADVVYVYGNVNKQGQVVIKEPITLTQALASSEGLKPATKKDNVRVLRQKPGSLEREEFVYDLNAIDKRKVQDPYLQPNDIVAVSEDKTKSILNAIRNSLTQGASSIFYRFPIK